MKRYFDRFDSEILEGDLITYPLMFGRSPEVAIYAYMMHTTGELRFFKIKQIHTDMGYAWEINDRPSSITETNRGMIIPRPGDSSGFDQLFKLVSDKAEV